MHFSCAGFLQGKELTDQGESEKNVINKIQ
jgi:hypothetical protein